MFFYYWLIAVMPLDQHWLWGHTIAGNFTVIKALGLLVFGIAMLRLAARRAPVRFLYTSQARWYLAFVLLQCLSYFEHAGDLVDPIGAYSHVLSIATLFLTVSIMVDSWARLQWSLLVAIGAVGYVSLYVLRTAQLYGADSRPGGMFGDANEYALLVGMWMPLAFVWTLSGTRPRWERLFCLCCLGLALFGTTFAASRGGFLGFVASFVYLIGHSKHKVRNLSLIAGVALPLVLLLPASPLQRLRHPRYGDEEAKNARLITWRAGLRMVRAHPVVGVGIETFKARVLEYEGPGEHIFSLCHNTYIEIASELGVAALVPFLGVLLASLFSLRRVRRKFARGGDAHAVATCLGLEAGTLSFLVSAVFVSAWWEKLVWLQVFLAMSVIRLSGRRHRGAPMVLRGSGREGAFEPAEAVVTAPGSRG